MTNKITPEQAKELTPIAWKSTVVAPPDCKRPRCKVILSTNGVDGRLVEDATDEQDWLCAIAYEAQQ